MVVSNSLTMIKTKKSKKQAKIAREIIAEVGPKQKTFDSDDEDVTNARVVVNEKVSVLQLDCLKGFHLHFGLNERNRTRMTRGTLTLKLNVVI